MSHTCNLSCKIKHPGAVPQQKRKNTRPSEHLQVFELRHRAIAIQRLRGRFHKGGNTERTCIENGWQGQWACMFLAYLSPELIVFRNLTAWSPKWISSKISFFNIQQTSAGPLVARALALPDEPTSETGSPGHSPPGCLQMIGLWQQLPGYPTYECKFKHQT